MMSQVMSRLIDQKHVFINFEDIRLRGFDEQDYLNLLTLANTESTTIFLFD